MKELVYIYLCLINIYTVLSSSNSFLENYSQQGLKFLEGALIESKSRLNIKCFWISSTNVYTLYTLRNKVEDYSAPLSKKEGEEEEIIQYNFCIDTVERCPNSTLSAGSVMYKKGNVCKYIAGTIEGNETTKNTWEEINENKGTGLKISLAEGEKCDDNNSRYSLTYEIFCNVSQSDVILNFTNFDINKCKNVIQGSSKHACSLNNYYRFQAFFENNRYYISFVVSAFGLVLAAFGKKLFKFLAVILCGIALVQLVGILIVNLIKQWFTKELYIWITLGVSFIVGMVVGIILLKCITVLFFIVGGAFGYVIGVFVYDILIMYVNWNGTIVYWVTIGIAIIVFGIIGLKVEVLITIIATSVIGGYAAVRGMSFIIGGFPDESKIFDLASEKEWDQLKEMITNWALFYFVVWILIAVGGIVLQCKTDDGSKVKDNKNGYKQLKD